MEPEEETSVRNLADLTTEELITEHGNAHQAHVELFRLSKSSYGTAASFYLGRAAADAYDDKCGIVAEIVRRVRDRGSA